MNVQYNLGVDKSENPIMGFTDSIYHSSDNIHRVAIISGLSGLDNSDSFFSTATKGIESISNQIGFIASNVGANTTGSSEYQFPPPTKTFHELENPEEMYIWRWLTMDSPDVVIELVESNRSETLIETIGFGEKNKYGLEYTAFRGDSSLLSALASGSGPTPGPIPGIRITSESKNVNQALAGIITEISKTPPSRSEASEELQRRVSRTPKEVSNKLAQVYGFKLDQPINYVQGVAISGRLRLKAIDPDYSDPNKDIVALVEFLTEDLAFNENSKEGPNLAAMCWAEDLYEATSDSRWKDLLVKTAETYEKVPAGTSPKPCHPEFGCEDMFFISAMLGRAYKVTGQTIYADAYVNFLLDANIQQDNGLFWHNRTTPYFWGRGNGFASLAYAEALSYLPENHPRRDELLTIHIKHLEGMIAHQLPSGTWSQLIDLPGTYQEMSVTCMIGYSIARGIRKGWLDNSYMPSLEKIWSAAKRRIADNGDLVDVCSGTGFQQKRSDYIYRKAEYGYDDRGGSMAIWFSTEMAMLQQND